MKFLITAAVLIIGCASSVSAASAQKVWTCTERANACINNGGKNEVCFSKKVMSHCRRTGEYIGPYSGRVFRATIRK
jgi:hypothetical protein